MNHCNTECEICKLTHNVHTCLVALNLKFLTLLKLKVYYASSRSFFSFHFEIYDTEGRKLLMSGNKLFRKIFMPKTVEWVGSL